MKFVRISIKLLVLALLLGGVLTVRLRLIRASEPSMGITPMPSSHATIDAEDAGPKISSTSTISLKDQITKVTVALPHPLEKEGGSWCTWGGCSISPRLYHEPLADGRTLVGWRDSSGDGHVSVISDATIAHTFDFPNESVRSLVAHDDGTFAVLLGSSDVMSLSKHSEDGSELWTTPLTGEDAFPEFGLGDSRLAYGDGIYAAYFSIGSRHAGDQLTLVDDNGVIQDGGWGWGCSHSLGELVVYHPDLDQFIAVCASDCYSSKGILINNNQRVYEADGNCGGSVSAQVGQLAPAEGSWKLLFNAWDRPCCEGHGIAMATIDENYESSYKWLTDTDGEDERDPVIARLGSDDQTERYLVGWTTTDDDAYWLGIVDGEGNFLAGPEDVSSAGVAWGNRDNSFHTCADGSVSWVQGDEMRRKLHLFRFEETTHTPPVMVYLPLILRDFDPANLPTPTSTPTPKPGWHVECADCPKYFTEMTDRALKLDTDGQPHIAYGGDHLYYAWLDGNWWRIETVDSADGVGRFAALALDSANHPHIGYYDAVNEDLKYAFWDGSNWAVQTVNSERDVKGGAALALDSADRPHLVVYDQTNYDLYYIYRDGATWFTEAVDGADCGDSGQTSLALDSQDRPHISCRGADGSLKYATKTNGVWTIQMVDAQASPGEISLVVDADDQPHVGYEAEAVSPHEIRYARWNGSSWYTQTVAQIGTWGCGCPSLAVDAAGQPHISFHDPDYSQVRYAKWDGSEWVVEAVGSDGWWGGYNSLALGTDDRPHVAYHVNPPFQIRYAVKDGEEWVAEIVDAGGDVGGWSSIDADANGHLHVSYHDGPNMSLKYSSYDGTTWTQQTIDEGWYLGEHGALAVDSAGYPHISYRGNDDLLYARWDGADWNIETVDDSGSAGGYTSLALDSDDHPHISHHDWGDQTLKYAAWDGQLWITHTVDSIGDSGGCSHTSLAIDAADHPAIAYYDADGKDLKLARWNGTSWVTQTVESEEDVGCSPALAFDSAGEPHIAYYDSSEGKIKYTFCDGTEWITQTVASQGTWSLCSDLVLDDDDQPHIAYTNGYSENDPMYAYWDGAEWIVETIESDNDAGTGISLVLDPSGIPHVTFRDDTNGALKHAWRR